MLAAGGCHKPQPQGADGGASLKEARLWIIQQGQAPLPLSEFNSNESLFWNFEDEIALFIGGSSSGEPA